MSMRYEKILKPLQVSPRRGRDTRLRRSCTGDRSRSRTSGAAGSRPSQEEFAVAVQPPHDNEDDEDTMLVTLSEESFEAANLHHKRYWEGLIDTIKKHRLECKKDGIEAASKDMLACNDEDPEEQRCSRAWAAAQERARVAWDARLGIVAKVLYEELAQYAKLGDAEEEAARQRSEAKQLIVRTIA
jgi:hypothetical protein